MLIAEIPQRWCVERMQHNFERDSYMTEQGDLNYSIVVEVRIVLMGLTNSLD